MSSDLTSQERRQYFISHVTTSHKSVEFVDEDSSFPVDDIYSDGSRSPSNSVVTDSLGSVSQSPFLVAAGTVSSPRSSPLKSIIKTSSPKRQQQSPTQQNHQQQIEFHLIQPGDEEQTIIDSIHAPLTPDTSGTIETMPTEVPLIRTEQPPANGTAVSDDVLFDPMCDPANPKVVQFQDISAAAFKIKSGIMMTPCTRSHLSNLTGMQLFFKKDFLQYTGSFKERGARFALLMLPEAKKVAGVIAASAGNHALALSYHGQELGIPVTVVMPIVAPIMKVQSCRQYGANIVIHGKDIGESREFAMRLAKEKSFTYINGYDHPHIIAGQGTMGLEIVEQVKNIDAVVVPVGGGGLIAGIALAVKSLHPQIQVIGVESERCASFSSALQAGQPIYTKADSTLADGLAVPKVGINALATAAPLVDKCVVVKEEFIAMAILRLVEIEKAVVEGAGACGLAAILAGLLPELKGKRVVIPLCGGNIDTTVLGRCLERGLAVDGRLVKFSVTVSDRPGGIAELCRLMANLGVSIKDILHERAWLKSDIFSVEVRVMCETRDLEHAVELERALKEHYQNVHFGHMADALGSGGLKSDLLDSRSPLL